MSTVILTAAVALFPLWESSYGASSSGRKNMDIFAAVLSGLSADARWQLANSPTVPEVPPPRSADPIGSGERADIAGPIRELIAK